MNAKCDEPYVLLPRVLLEFLNPTESLVFILRRRKRTRNMKISFQSILKDTLSTTKSDLHEKKQAGSQNMSHHKKLKVFHDFTICFVTFYELFLQFLFQ
jgi:hypothetical protein